MNESVLSKNSVNQHRSSGGRLELCIDTETVFRDGYVIAAPLVLSEWVSRFGVRLPSTVYRLLSTLGASPPKHDRRQVIRLRGSA